MQATSELTLTERRNRGLPVEKRSTAYESNV